MLEILIVIFSCGGSVVIAALAAHRLSLMWMYFHRAARAAPNFNTALSSETREVLVQLPIYNEMNVAARAIAALAALDWPRDRLEIQILDDSDDETARIAAEEVARYAAAGVPITHLRRGSRDGFKAGALAWGLARARFTGRETLVAIFDADFVPQPDFLRRAAAALIADPKLGLVQARWTHLNADENAITRAQALALDGHFVMESLARARGGRFFNFNGTAGVWRRAAIEDAGGWTADTLTEDLDISYRAQLAGWRFAMAPEIEAPAELPATLGALKSQQRRWAAGSAQTARKLAPRIRRARLPLAVKIEAFAHLGCNLAYPALLAMALTLWPMSRLRAEWLADPLAWIDAPALALGVWALAVFYGNARRELGESPWRTAARLPVLMALGAGLAVNNTLATLRGLARPGGEFIRTPKRGERGLKRYAPARAIATPTLEWAALIWLGAGLIDTLLQGRWSAVPFQVLFTAGFAWVGAGETLGTWTKLFARLKLMVEHAHRGK